MHQILPAAAVLGGRGDLAQLKVVPVTAQAALEAEQVQHILYGFVVLLHPQVRVVLVILAGLIETARLFRQSDKLAYYIIVRRDGVLCSVFVHDLAADIRRVEDLFVAQADIFPVVVKSQVDALRLCQRFGENAHAEAIAARDVFDCCRAEQGKPGRRASYRDALHHARRGRHLAEVRHSRNRAGRPEPLVADGSPGLVAGVRL